jgi:hypothetical protein
MSIIIYSQSLENKRIQDISIDGEFPPSREKIDLLSIFFKNLGKIKSRENAVNEVQSFIVSSNSIFKIYCKEKDNLGRNSPILIQATKSDLGKVQEYLKSFLEDCKDKGSGVRTVDDDIKNELESKIKKYENRKSFRNITIFKHITKCIFFILAIFFFCYLYYKEIKK